ncbi:MAG: DNA cytosine methyltransferase [Cetobacterium sp.]
MLKVLSLCSGIGGLEGGLEGVVDYQIINYAENDKYAKEGFSLIHNVSENLNLGDVTEIECEQLEDFDLLVGGYPCTDVSTMGKRAGFENEDGSKTRTGLIDYFIEIIRCKKPKYIVLENVKGIYDRKHKPGMDKRVSAIEEIGYVSHIKLLNAKYYDSGQHRERYFFVFIREDLDTSFEFPDSNVVTKYFEDILEDNVDEKYYLSEKALARLEGKDRAELMIENNDNINILIQDTYRKKVYDTKGVAPTVIESHGDCIRIIDRNTNRIRVITPREALRLQGFTDSEIDRISFMSDAQLYKRAGNAVCKKVSNALFKQLFNK